MSGFFICGILSYLQLNLGIMKKITIFLSVCFLALVSCSSDGDTPQATTGTRLVKAIVTSPDGFYLESNYLYNGALLYKMTDSEGYWNSYVYTGLNITRIDSYGPSNQYRGTTYCTYDSQNRITVRKSINVAEQTGFKTVFTYDGEGNAVLTKFTGDHLSQDTPSGNTIEKYFIANELVTKREITNNTTSETLTYTYTYDGKNNKFKGIPGYSKVLLGVGFGNVETTQNTITQTITSNMSPNVYTEEFSYVYNSLNYPVTATQSEGGSIISQLSLQYQ